MTLICSNMRMRRRQGCLPNTQSVASALHCPEQITTWPLQLPWFSARGWVQFGSRENCSVVNSKSSRLSYAGDSQHQHTNDCCCADQGLSLRRRWSKLPARASVVKTARTRTLHTQQRLQTALRDYKLFRFALVACCTCCMLQLLCAAARAETLLYHGAPLQPMTDCNQRPNRWTTAALGRM